METGRGYTKRGNQKKKKIRLNCTMKKINTKFSNKANK